MDYNIVWVRGHVEVYDWAGRFCFSADNEREALEELESNTGCHYERLYIVGGGAKNAFLNRLTEEAAGKKVIALPIEAAALGNLKIQLEVMK